MEKKKAVVVVGFALRYLETEAELFPVLGKLYSEGYVVATDHEENYLVSTESLDYLDLEGDETDVELLKSEGFTVYNLKALGKLEEL